MSETKLRYSLIPPRSLRSVAGAFASGVEKHGERDYLSGEYSAQDYIDKMFRHLIAICLGEWDSEDDGVPHAAAIAADAMIYQAIVELDEYVEGATKTPAHLAHVDACAQAEIKPIDEITKCPDCKGHFSDEYMEKHICKEKVVGYYCPHCDRVPPNKEALAQHIAAKHSAATPVGIEQSPSMTGQAGTTVGVNRNEPCPPNSFMDSKPFRCDHCDGRFPTYTTLLNHLQQVGHSSGLRPHPIGSEAAKAG